jgi:hypothetical protein
LHFYTQPFDLDIFVAYNKYSSVPIVVTKIVAKGKWNITMHSVSVTYHSFDIFLICPPVMYIDFIAPTIDEQETNTS